MNRSTKDGCPKCGVKLRTGPLPSAKEKREFERSGIVDLGEPPERIDCPKCRTALRVVSVRMGTYFTAE